MRPMLACKTLPFDKLRFPLIASPKLDGIRCIIADGVALSRSLKPIPNLHVQKLLGVRELHGYDGELIIGAANAPDVYHKTHSGVMTYSGEPEFTYFVFDRWDLPESPYQSRVSAILNWAPKVKVLPTYWVKSEAELVKAEEAAVQLGYEGLILRSPEGLYKHGRSTPKEQGMVKVKRFCDSEAVITGFVELMHNDNEATESELGLTKRSSHKENLRPGGTLGALQVRDIHTGVEFEIGTGFTQEERRAIWNGRYTPHMMLAKYRYFPVGVKDKPRHPVFKGWRHVDDLDAELKQA